MGRSLQRVNLRHFKIGSWGYRMADGRFASPCFLPAIFDCLFGTHSSTDILTGPSVNKPIRTGRNENLP